MRYDTVTSGGFAIDFSRRTCLAWDCLVLDPNPPLTDSSSGMILSPLTGHQDR